MEYMGNASVMSWLVFINAFTLVEDECGRIMMETSTERKLFYRSPSKRLSNVIAFTTRQLSVPRNIHQTRVSSHAEMLRPRSPTSAYLHTADHTPTLSHAQPVQPYPSTQNPNFPTLTLAPNPTTTAPPATSTTQSRTPNTPLNPVPVAAATVATHSPTSAYPLSRCHLYTPLALALPPYTAPGAHSAVAPTRPCTPRMM